MTKKKLKIAIVSKLWEETSPDSRGGTGSSIGLLVDGLVKRGHHVTLFASGDSKTRAQKLISIRPKHYQGDYSEVHEFENIASAFRLAKNFDIIHCAVEHKSVFFGDLTSTPSLHSIRYGEFFNHELSLLKKYRRLNYVGNSLAIKKMLPFLNWRGIVHNGLDPQQFICQKKTGDYLLYLARLTPQKGVDLVIQAAKKLGMKLIIAGRASQTDQDFLNKKVYPFIDNRQIIYRGEILGQQKKRLLSGALCLVQANRIFEACSNSLLEAMASAVPVVAFNRGANSELINNGRTGYLVNNQRGMIAAIKKIKNLRKSDCRQRVFDHFSSELMVDGYEQIYRQIISRPNG